MNAGGGRDRHAVLVVEDSSAHAELIRRAFRETPQFEVSVAPDLATARERLSTSPPDLALVDYLLPDGSGIDLLARAGERPPVPIVIMTSHGNEEVAVDAMKRGAIDYVVKSDDSLRRLPEVARRVLREHHLMLESARAKEKVRHRDLQYRAVFDSSTNGLVIRRMTDAKAVAVNPAMAEMLGYAPGEYLELRPEEFVHPDQLMQWRQAFETACAGETEAFEASYSRRDGSVADIRGHLVPFLYEGEEHILDVRP
jgi:PAS domain S-box-containing protein